MNVLANLVSLNKSQINMEPFGPSSRIVNTNHSICLFEAYFLFGDYKTNKNAQTVNTLNVHLFH